MTFPNRLTPDGKMACGSCDADWPMPARYMAHPKMADGSQGEPWPVCNLHAPFAMCAGWFPLDEISEDAAQARAETPQDGSVSG